MANNPSILTLLMNAAEQGTPAVFQTRPVLRQGKNDLLLVGLDNGNDALKGAVLAEDGRLVTVRIPTAFRTALVIHGGKHETSYTTGDTTFWIGESALNHQGDSLAIGPTYHRLVDPRMRQFLAASVVELLVTAGYSPGSYTLALGFAIPNTELAPLASDEGGRLAVIEATRTVLTEHLKGACWRLTRSTAAEQVSEWELEIALVLPQAQTAGTLLAATKAPNGKTVSDLEGITVLDIGGGDLQHIRCSIRPYQLVARRLGDGTIRIARALRERFPTMAELNDVAAQHALISRQLMIAGRTRDIAPQVEEVLASQGQALLADLLPALRQSQQFVILTGGGVILLDRLLQERLALEQKRAGEEYLVIPHRLASVLNAIAALFAILFAKRGD